jgi:hypothetical protein
VLDGAEMICPHCGAEYPDNHHCWNCTPAHAVASEQVPEVNVHHVPEDVRQRLEERWRA